MNQTEWLWLLIGFSGQILFSGRFLLQWLKSEKHKKSIVPVEFWYLSIAGGLTLLIYALHKKDPVFILGQLFGVFIYSRNLYFIYSKPVKKTGREINDI